MDLQFVKGSYMDEIKLGDRHVLFTLEGLDEGQEKRRMNTAKKFGIGFFSIIRRCWRMQALLPVLKIKNGMSMERLKFRQKKCVNT